ncbi:ATP-DEPENDENT HELICASE HRQ1 [Salix koriyanagi]|uniref:ATP-DEPENDENT HELICASE HRQ1 n=1 Tax=Salix koriyanagi TaxID=2511006 RepID=A0A9Q1AB83_9ROSI|nr:ATP-DEPENDENT HELICASE HRQ1 [Salix koriyanagi]
MVQHGLHCIPFCRSRKLTEIVLSYTHEILQKIAPYLVDSICAYRAGYVVEKGQIASVRFLHWSEVMKQHLVCAALEHPLSLLPAEKYFGSSLSNGLMTLKNKGDLSLDPSLDSSSTIWSYIIGHEKMPSCGISIRAIESIRHGVIDMQWNEVLEEIEKSKAFFQIYEGAVCMHQGKTYMVKELDISEKIALCYEANLYYYTKTRYYTDNELAKIAFFCYAAAS